MNDSYDPASGSQDMRRPPSQQQSHSFSPYSIQDYAPTTYETPAWATAYSTPSSADFSTQPSSSNPFNPLDHTRISPSNFDPNQFHSNFVTPKFASKTQQYWGGDGGEGATIIEPNASAYGSSSGVFSMNAEGSAGYETHQKNFFSDRGVQEGYIGGGQSQQSMASGVAMTEMTGSPSMLMGPPMLPSGTTSSASHFAQRHRQSFSNQQQLPQSQQRNHSVNPNDTTLSSTSPIYDLYGSSVVSVASPTQLSPHKLNSSAPFAATFGSNHAGPSSPYNPEQLGLPLPPGKDAGDTNWKGLYSTSGMDMLGVLARVAARPNPEINIGPVDMGCSFTVVDAKKYDQPIVFASETFTRLTGYTSDEILGRNCRFLQSPDGIVGQGEKRRYTDGNAVYHLKRYCQIGKESQASLINYCKGGKPFINLVTCIPISWDSDEIAYYVGFQVDLVEQPTAILEKMKNGTYVVNYSVLGSAIIPNPTIVSTEPEPTSPLMGTIKAEQMDIDDGVDVLSTIQESGVAGLVSDVNKRSFHKLLLENSNDLVYVLSLKGSLLYMSPSASKMLEYSPSELVGKPISAFCHPSDIVAVLRELKDSGSIAHSSVSMLYRIRRKTSGYMWMESAGKLHLEQGKGRKCVILVGRPRPVYKVSWSDLDRVGGFGGVEFWSKYSLGGMHLYTTPSVREMLGHSPQDLVGTSVQSLDPSGTVLAHIREIGKSQAPVLMTVRHQFKSKTGGNIEVTTNLYPSRTIADDPREVQGSDFTIIAQTKLYAGNTENRPPLPFPGHKMYRTSSSSTNSGSMPVPNTASPGMVALPTYRSNSDGESSSSGSNSTNSFSAIPSTFKSLTTSSDSSDNVFAELDGTRGTSWQFELHQLRLTNKKLREEKAALLAMQKKKKRKLARGASPSVPDDGPRSCANCGKTSSPEWRSGPTGPKTLCNRCGLRYRKAVPSAARSGSSGSDPSSRSGSSSSTSRSPVAPSPSLGTQDALLRASSLSLGSTPSLPLPI